MATSWFELQWQSTPQERYDTEMNRKAEQYLLDQGIRVIESFGGTDLFSQVSDNGFVIAVTDPAKAEAAAAALTEIVGHSVSMRKEGA